MKKLIFLFLLSVAFSHAQTVDTSTTTKKAQYWVQQTAKFRVLSLPDRTLSNTLRSLQNLAVGRTPYLSISQLRAGEADTAPYVNVTEGGRSGIFMYDASDATSEDDTSMVIRNGSRRYKRLLYDNKIRPAWFGAVGNGTTNDAYRLQLALTWATANNKDVEIPYGSSYLVRSTITSGSNISGFGTIKTRTGAAIILSRSGLTVRDISINGRDETNGNAISGSSIQASARANLTMDNVKVSGVVGQGFWFSGCNFGKVVNCIVTDVRGSAGDGIYFTASISPYIAGNTVSGHQRIGITCENRSYYPQIIGNTCKNSFKNTGGQINGGIWIERTDGGVISNNILEGNMDRSIVVTPAVVNGVSYNYNVSNNICTGATHGLAFVFAEGQNLLADGNSFTDNAIGIEIGWAKSVKISNSGFYRRDSLETSLSELIRLVPSLVAGNLTTATIENCFSDRVLKPNLRAINIPNTSGFKCNLTIKNTVGNFSVLTYANPIAGTATYSNVTMDYSNVDNTSTYLANFSLGTFFKDCDLRFSSTNNFLMQGAKAEFTRCDMRSLDSPVRLQLSTFGTPYVAFRSCIMDKILLYNLRKTGTSVILLNNEISGYEADGFIHTVVQQVGYLDLRGNRFTSATHPTAVPIQLTLGVTDSDIGINSFRSTVVTTAQNPKYLQPETFVNNATAVPLKTAINAVYGNAKAGSTALYRGITIGARSYFKITDSNTSDWRYTIESTGEQGIAP